MQREPFRLNNRSGKFLPIQVRSSVIQFLPNKKCGASGIADDKQCRLGEVKLAPGNLPSAVLGDWLKMVGQMEGEARDEKGYVTLLSAIRRAKETATSEKQDKILGMLEKHEAKAKSDLAHYQKLGNKKCGASGIPDEDTCHVGGEGQAGDPKTFTDDEGIVHSHQFASAKEETKARNSANRELSAMNYNTYHASIPLEKMGDILKKHGFSAKGLDGIYTGASGSADARVGPRSWLHQTWYKMPSGRYESVAYIS